LPKIRNFCILGGTFPVGTIPDGGHAHSKRVRPDLVAARFSGSLHLGDTLQRHPTRICPFVNHEKKILINSACRKDVSMRPFSLLVKPSGADCNLQCKYCFYLKKCSLYPGSKVHRMSEKVADRMLSTFLATDQPRYAIGWQGGEPTLMGLNFFKFVTKKQKEYGRGGKQVSNGLQTNGTLLNDDWAKHLAKYNFLTGVSLDGPEKVHDASRLNPAGRGSHADVMRGIECLKRQGAKFNILTLVNRENVDKPAQIYRYMVDHGFFFQQYIECVEFDQAGKTMPYAVNGEEWGEFLCGIFDEWKKTDVRRVSIRLFDSILAKMVDGIATVCAMGTNCCQYLVVEHNGDVYPCDFFVEPDLKLGNVMENSWDELLQSPVYHAFGARKASCNEKCSGCSYFNYCAGGCQKHRYSKAPKPTELSHLCGGWEIFYPHVLPFFEELADEIRRERASAEARMRMQQMQAQVPTGKPGRNAPCPCGSGRKYKKCCGR